MNEAVELKQIYWSEAQGRFEMSGLSNGAGSMKDASLANWEVNGGDADDDIVANLSIVRERCRDLALNAPVVAGVVNMLVTNVVGQGLIPEPTPDGEMLGMSTEDAARWKRQVLRLWEAFAEGKSCDVTGTANFYELTQLIFRSEIESGDVFAALPYVEHSGSIIDLKVQVIEADCISDPSAAKRSEVEGDVYGGVEVGGHGEVLAYWVATRHPLAKRYPFFIGQKHPYQRDWIRIPARGAESGRLNLMHVMRAMRPGQRRGVPLLAPVVKATKQLDRYISAELQAALVQSLFTVAVTSASPESATGEMEAQAALYDDEMKLTPSQKYYNEYGKIQMGPGNVSFLAPGDSVQPVGVSRPFNGFGPFVENQLKLIGMSVGLPYEMLTMYFQTSFSASRAAINMATSGFKVYRDHLASDFCQPVYDAFMTEVVAAGMIDAPGFFSDPLKRRAYCMAKWAGPGSLQIDAGKELDAYGKAIGLGLVTRGQAASEYNGSDFRQNAAILHEEQEVMDAAPWDTAPLKIGSKYGDGGVGSDAAVQQAAD